MSNKKVCGAFRVMSLLLALILILPVSTMAAESRSSLYLNSYTAYIYRAGWGNIQVWFEVDSLNDMDEIGVLEIQIYESTDNENWYWVDTYMYPDYPDMLAYNDHLHVGHIEYDGTIGRYYKAYVCVWAGKNGNGDTRYFWTSAKKATLFAE